jgi:hypothetical protein
LEAEREASMLKQRWLGLGLGSVLAIGAHAPALGQSRSFDGAWSVLLITESGICDRAYRYPVEVVKGTLHYRAGAGGSSFNFAGRIDRHGIVNVRISSGRNWVNAKGRLATRYGPGSWNSPSLNCSGRWRADRRSR